MTIFGGVKPIYEMGDRYIIEGGCPRCGSDLEVTHEIAEVCVNYRYKTDFSIEFPCNHAIMGG